MRRTATLLPAALPALAATGVLSLALAPSAAAAQPDDGAAYLAGRLADGGDRLTTEFDGTSYDDIGLTLDAVLSLAAAGAGEDQATATTDYVVAGAAAYAGTDDGDAYAGASAKLLLTAVVRGLDPTDVGGADLVTRLQGLEAESGRYTDRSEFGDYSNAIGQSLGLIGLSRAGVNPSTAAVDYLLDQQCADGGFSLELDAEECTSDPDATAFAVQALSYGGGTGDLDAVVSDAADYLEGVQADSGGVGGAGPTAGINANSTGLAAMALRTAGRDDAADAAVDYLGTLVLGCDTPALAGGIAYTEEAKTALEAEGGDAAADDQTTRSTAQALIALSGQTYTTVTAEGAAAGVTAPSCDGGEPTGEPTDPTDPTDPTGEPTQPTETPTDGTSTGQPGAPETPGVVQTDSAVDPAGPPVLLAGALGLVALAGTGATLALARTEPRRTRRH